MSLMQRCVLESVIDRGLLEHMEDPLNTCLVQVYIFVSEIDRGMRASGHLEVCGIEIYIVSQN